MSNRESNSSKVFKSMHSQTLVTVIMGVLELVYFSFMSRLLSQEVFGLFALITAVTIVLTSLTDAGLGASIIQKKNADTAFESTAFTLSIISGLIFTLILFFGAPLFSKLMIDNDTLTLPFRIMSCIMLLQGINNIHNARYVKRLNFFKLGIYRAIAYIVSSVIGILMAFYGFQVYSIIAAIISNQIFFTVIMFIVNRDWNLKIGLHKEYIKQIVGFGGWLTGTVIIRNITNQVDKIIVARLLSVSIVGAINRPNGFISTISTKINGIFDTILFPILSSIQDNKSAVKAAFEKSISLITVFSSFLSGVIVLGSKYIIEIFFGPEWDNIQPLIWIFGFCILFSGLSRIEDCFFRSLGKMKSYFLARLINCLTAIALIVWGSFYGMIGVAFAILGREVVSVLTKFFMLKPYIGFKMKDFIKTVINNTWLSVLLEISFLLVIILVPVTRYFFIFIYILILSLLIFFIPKVFGELFYSQIYLRYINKIKISFVKRFSF